MSSQWGTVGLEQVPKDNGDICMSVDLDEWRCLVFYCGNVWQAHTSSDGVLLDKQVTETTWRGDFLRRYNDRVEALMDEARQEAKSLEEREAYNQMAPKET